MVAVEKQMMASDTSFAFHCSNLHIVKKVQIYVHVMSAPNLHDKPDLSLEPLVKLLPVECDGSSSPHSTACKQQHVEPTSDTCSI